MVTLMKRAIGHVDLRRQRSGKYLLLPHEGEWREEFWEKE